MTAPPEHHQADLLIVGAGPVGLYAAYYAGFRGLSTVILDALPEPGGQISAMYPEKLIYDVAGFPAVRGRDLVDGLVAQTAPFSPQYLLSRSATRVTIGTDGGFEVEADGVLGERGATISCRALLLSGGIGSFTPRPLPSAGDWLGRGLSYFVPSLVAHADQDVVIVGGGDSACDWALGLAPVARSVVLVHRRAAFRAHAHSLAQLAEAPIEVITDAEVTKLLGGEAVEAVEITLKDGTTASHPADAVVAALGFTAHLGPLEQWGLEIVDRRHLVVDTTMSTNVAGVYAAGDIVDYPGKVRLISVGFGEAATAVNNAAVRIHPDEPLFPGHSSDKPATEH